MPKAGHGCEDTQNLEDDTARLLTACDLLDWLRGFGMVLQQRGAITEPTYRHYRDACEGVSAGLTIGRRNTARLRNETRP